MSSLTIALEQLAAIKAGAERAFRTVDYDWAGGASLKGMFVYPGFTHGIANIDALVDFLDRSLVDYSIPSTEVTAACKPGPLNLTNEGAVAALLKSALTETGDADAVAYAPAIPLFVEMSASSETMLSFMELGLSRITARLLQDRAVHRDPDTPPARRWIDCHSSLVEQLLTAYRREIVVATG